MSVCTIIMEMIEMNTNKSFYTKVVGVTFDNRQEYVKRCYRGQELKLVRDKFNAYDRNAVAVYAQNNQIGFLSRELAEKIAFQIDNGITFRCFVETITGGGYQNYGVNIRIVNTNENYKTNSKAVSCNKNEQINIENKISDEKNDKRENNISTGIKFGICFGAFLGVILMGEFGAISIVYGICLGVVLGIFIGK